MKMFKRILSLLILTCMIAAAMPVFCGTAFADSRDTSKAGTYYVDTVTPSDHTYSYIYDQPSSTKGKNLGRVNDGETVYLYWVQNGLGKKTSKWAYCEYNGAKGFIRWDNLSTSKPAPRPTSKPTAKPTAKPSSKPISGAYVEMSGNANIRAGAGTDYKSIGNIANGSRAEYLNESKYDARPVLWYKIRYNGKVGWVSSKYATLVGKAGSTSSSIADSVYDKSTAGSTELSGYYLKDLKRTAAALDLPNYRHVISEAPDTYFNGSLTIGGDLELASVVSYLDLFGEGYKVYGVTIGMRVDQA